MKNLVLMLLSLVIRGTFFGQIDNCPCGETQGLNHDRQETKNRAMPLSISSVSTATVGKMTKWRIFTHDKSNEPGHLYDREKKLYKLTGYIMLTKISPDDCDIHMEIASSPDTSADRIIAEVPNTNEYCGVQKQIFDAVKAKLNKKLGTTGRRFDSSTGFIKLTVTGYAFFDQSHYSYSNPKKGHGHGSSHVATIWEIHPVVRVVPE